MSANSSSCQVVAEIISTLGGPAIEAAEIEWASHLPAGKLLLRWLADQCVGAVEGVGEGGGNNAALRAVALEHEELQILKHRTGGPTVADTIHAPPDYEPPSRLNKRAHHLETEINILGAEEALLKSRIRLTQQASKESVQTIKSLKAAIDREDAIIARTQERLAELSILADTTLSSGKSTALSLLDTLQSKAPSEFTSDENRKPGHASLTSATSTLTSLSSLRSSVVSQHLEHLESVDASRAGQTLTRRLSPNELSDEATQLSKSISSLLEGGKKSRIRDAAFALELQRIYEEGLGIDDGTGGGTSLVKHGESSEVRGPLNVRAELEKAWALDQANLLDFERDVLDSTLNAYTQLLLPGLTELHTRLAGHERVVRSAEAWVGALGLEVEGVRDEVDAATSVIEGEPRNENSASEEELETQLKNLLLKHQSDAVEKAADKGTPLVLLDRADILEELRHIQAEVDPDAGWIEIEGVKKALGTLSATHFPLLTTLYQNSSMNTSPPFSSSARVTRLEKEAREAGARLGAALGRDGVGEDTQKVLDSSRTKRKLDTFVDRWIAME